MRTLRNVDKSLLVTVGISIVFFWPRDVSGRDRLINSSGVATVRQEAFHSDDRIVCVPFARIEDRTTRGNEGYYVFWTSTGKQIQLRPNAILHKFFLEQVQLPEKDLADGPEAAEYKYLSNELSRLSQFNGKVKIALSPFIAKLDKTVLRLSRGDHWKNGRWVTLEQRRKELVKREKYDIENKSNDMREMLAAARDYDDLQTLKLILSHLKAVPATTSETVALRSSTYDKLDIALNTKTIEIERSEIEKRSTSIKSALTYAADEDDIKNLKLAISELEALNLGTTSNIALRNSSYEELVIMLEGKKTEIQRKIDLTRLSLGVFEDFTAWKSAIQTLQSSSVEMRSEEQRVVTQAEEAYDNSLVVFRKIKNSHNEMIDFFKNIEPEAFMHDKKLPNLSKNFLQTLNTYRDFLQSGATINPPEITELDAKADQFSEDVAMYKELQGLTELARREQLWDRMEDLNFVLRYMPALATSIGDERLAYEKAMESGRANYAESNFKESEREYQAAFKIFPSQDVSNKIEAARGSNLGL